LHIYAHGIHFIIGDIDMSEAKKEINAKEAIELSLREKKNGGAL